MNSKRTIFTTFLILMMQLYCFADNPEIDENIKSVLNDFFQAQSKLNKLGVIKSRDYIGDIGRFLCQQLYKIKLNPRTQRELFDGTIGESKTKILFNNCPTGHAKIFVKKLDSFDELIVVLGPSSAQKPQKGTNEIVFYRFTVKDIADKFSSENNGYKANKELFTSGWDKILKLDL